jgi:hypothetical protein
VQHLEPSSEQVPLRLNIQTMRANYFNYSTTAIPDIGYAKRQTQHAPRRSDDSSIFQFQAMSAVEVARGADGARAAEDALATRPLSKTRPMESDFTKLFITCEESCVACMARIF